MAPAALPPAAPPPATPFEPGVLLAHVGFLRGLAERLMTDSAGADDVVQETLATALRRRPEVRDGLGGWLATVARHTAYRYTRSRRRRAERERRAARAEASPAPAPHEVLEREEARRRLVEAVLRLPAPAREVVLLRYYEGLPANEVARRLALPLETLRTRLRRAIERLRDELDERAGGRGAWTAALLPLVRPAGEAALAVTGALGGATVSAVGAGAAGAAGGVLMGAKAAGAVLGVALLAGTCWWLWPWSRTEEPAARARGGAVEQVDAAPAAHAGGTALAGSPAPGVAADGQDRAARSTRPDGLRLSGRVVDERRRGVPRARVTLVLPDARGAAALCDEAGRWQLALDPEALGWRPGWLRAEHGARVALAAAGELRSARGAIEWPALVLGEARALTVDVRDAAGPVPAAQLTLLELASAHLGIEAEHAGTADAAGRLRFEGLARTRVRVYAHGPGRGRGHAETEVLDAAGVLTVSVTDERTLDVEVRTEDGAPVADAEVWVSGPGTVLPPQGAGCLPPLPPLRTDAQGQVRVEGLPQGALRVLARAPGLAPSHPGGRRSSGAAVGPEERSVRLVLRPYRRVRLPIAGGDAGAPPDGTRLVATAHQGAHGLVEPFGEAFVRGAEVEIEHVPPAGAWGRVEAPDGLHADWIAGAAGDPSAPQPLQFRAARSLSVVLLDLESRPLSGEWLTLLLDPRGASAPQRTDAEGRAVFEGLRGTGASLRWLPREHAFGRELARLSLDGRGDGPLQERVLRVPRPREHWIEVHVGGERRLPATYALEVEQAGDGADDPPRWGDVPERDLLELPEEGAVAFRAPPPAAGSLRARLATPGFPVTEVVWQPAAAEPRRGVVTLVPGTVLRLRLTPPSDGRATVLLEGRDGAAWRDETQGPLAQGRLRFDAGGEARLPGAPPGRYRLVDAWSGVAGAPMDVAPGQAEVLLDLDLSAVVAADMQLRLPAGEDPALASVTVGGPALGGSVRPPVIEALGDGRHRVRAPRGQCLLWTVAHPLLLAPSAPLQQTVGEGALDVPLAAQPELRFRLAGSTFTTTVLGPGAVAFGPDGTVVNRLPGPVRLTVAASAEDLGSAAYQEPIARDGLFRLPLPRIGRSALCLYVQGCVPLVLPDVDLRAEGADLGLLAPSRGATLTLRLRGTGWPRRPHLLALVEHLGEPRYAAEGGAITPGDPPTIAIPGVGAGRFRVRLYDPFASGPSAPNPGALLYEHEVACDGRQDLTLDAAAR